jgi:FMN-dependent NADH-azoreductase
VDIVCISASNIKSSGENSTSLKLSKIIKEKCHKHMKSAQITIYDLRNYEFNSCMGCGACYENEYRCKIDDQYNHFVEKILKADVLFIVCPHYAPIPSKLSMFLEKLEQNVFLKRFNDENYRCLLFNKPLGIIGHGGGTKSLADWYKGVVIESISNALSFPIEMKMVDFDDVNRKGIIISVGNVNKNKDSIFPIQEYNWTSIEVVLEDYTKKVVSASSLYNSIVVGNAPVFKKYKKYNF